MPSYTTPDDHFTAGPDCRVIDSARGRVGGAGGCPTIRAGIVSPASVQMATSHFRPRRSFHCQSRLPCDRRAAGALVVLVAVQLSVLGLYLPPVLKWPYRSISIHPRRSFHCRSRLPCDRSGRGRVDRAGGCPTIRAGIVSPASVRKVVDIISAPDDHFTAGPDCRVNDSAVGALVSAGGCPTIRAGIVFPAGVRRIDFHPRRSFQLPVQTAV